jgi:acylglycerol lipase
MADAGVAVYTYDVHGHGRSEPTGPNDRGLITDYTHLVRHTGFNACRNSRCSASGISGEANAQALPPVVAASIPLT